MPELVEGNEIYSRYMKKKGSEARDRRGFFAPLIFTSQCMLRKPVVSISRLHSQFSLTELEALRNICSINYRDFHKPEVNPENLVSTIRSWLSAPNLSAQAEPLNQLLVTSAIFAFKIGQMAAALANQLK